MSTPEKATHFNSLQYDPATGKMIDTWSANFPDKARKVQDQNSASTIPPSEMDNKPKAILPKNRFTVSEIFYFQEVGSSPFTLDLTHSRNVDSEEQVYSRKTRIKDEWSPIEVGGLEEPSLVIIKNEVVQYQTYPTPEQRMLDETRVLLLGLKTYAEGCSLIPACGPYIQEFAKIRPGESIRLEVLNIKNFVIKSAFGECKTTIVAVP